MILRNSGEYMNYFKISNGKKCRYDVFLTKNYFFINDTNKNASINIIDSVIDYHLNKNITGIKVIPKVKVRKRQKYIEMIMEKEGLAFLMGVLSSMIDDYDINYTYIPNYNLNKYNSFMINKNKTIYSHIKVDTKPKGKRKVYYRR